jgi:hypothetical protein
MNNYNINNGKSLNKVKNNIISRIIVEEIVKVISYSIYNNHCLYPI